MNCPTLTQLLEAIAQAEAAVSKHTFARQWDLILFLAGKLREELNAVPQEDVAGRMERE